MSRLPRSRPVRRVAVLAPVTVAALVLAACGDGGSSDDDDRGDAASGVVVSALEELPATGGGDGFLVITTADLEQAAADGDLPSRRDDPQAWLRGLTLPPVVVRFPASVSNFVLPIDEAGDAPFAFRDTLSFVTLQDRTAGGVRSLEVYRLDRQPEERPVGDVQARVDGDRIALARETGWLDDWASDSTAADDHDLRSVAETLDEREVYTALITKPGDRAGRTDLPDFRAVGIGRTLDDGVGVEHVVYLVDDAEDAASAFEQVWRDQAGVGDVDVEVDDDLVVVRVTRADPDVPIGLAASLLESAAPPFDY